MPLEGSYALTRLTCLTMHTSQENLKPTIKHVVETYGEQIREIDYVATFKELCLKYEQNEDTSMLDSVRCVCVVMSLGGFTTACVIDMRNSHL